MKWFRHDTDMHRNRKLRKLVRTHGATGYAFWCVLLEKLYEGENGFQINADELWLEDMTEDLKLGDPRTPIRILDTLAELGLIDKQLWADHVIYLPGLAEEACKLKQESSYQKHRSAVFGRDGFKCVYCGSGQNLTLDHVIPQSRGGTHDPENLVACCASCNSSKGARTPKEWLGGGQ